MKSMTLVLSGQFHRIPYGTVCVALPSGLARLMLRISSHPIRLEEEADVLLEVGKDLNPNEIISFTRGNGNRYNELWISSPAACCDCF